MLTNVQVNDVNSREQCVLDGQSQNLGLGKGVLKILTTPSSIFRLGELPCHSAEVKLSADTKVAAGVQSSICSHSPLLAAGIYIKLHKSGSCHGSY